MDRVAVLQALINFHTPLSFALDQLREHPFDSDVELAEVRSHHVATALKLFLSRELNASQIEIWANAIEMRDDISIESKLEVREAMHELANPLLTQPLTLLRAQWWLSRLRD